MSDNYGKNISALILSVVVSLQQSSCGMHTAAALYARHCSIVHVQQHVVQQASRRACILQIGSVATAAGVGGGAFFVPLFNSLLNFSEQSAIHCSCQVHAPSMSAVRPFEQFSRYVIQDRVSDAMAHS